MEFILTLDAKLVAKLCIYVAGAVLLGWFLYLAWRAGP